MRSVCSSGPWNSKFRGDPHAGFRGLVETLERADGTADVRVDRLGNQTPLRIAMGET